MCFSAMIVRDPNEKWDEYMFMVMLNLRLWAESEQNNILLVVEYMALFSVYLTIANKAQ